MDATLPLNERVAGTEAQINLILKALERQVAVNDGVYDRCRDIELDVAKNLTGRTQGSDKTWVTIREILTLLVALGSLALIAFRSH